MFFFNFTIIIMYAYFTDISQGSVETHLWCGGCASDKNWENWSIIGKDMDKSKVPRFLVHPVQAHMETHE